MLVRTGYLILCLLGLVFPYAAFVPWLWTRGFDAVLFVRELFANRISTFFGLDVIVSALALLVFITHEGQRLRIKRWWLPVVGTLLAGVSFGLPMFLWMREAQRPTAASNAGAGGDRITDQDKT